MSETRRDLFKTSVLSGLGLMSASTLAGCSGSESWWPFGANPQGCWQNGQQDSPNWTLAHGTVNGVPNWYVFQYAPLSGTYSVFALKSGATPPPDQAQTHVPFDVLSFYTANKSDYPQSLGNFTITIKASSLSKPIKVASGVISDTTSKQTLQGFKYVPLSWNEIAP